MILMFHFLAIVAKYYYNQIKNRPKINGLNPALPFNSTSNLISYENRFKGSRASYNLNGDIYFDPPVYLQRYCCVQELIHDERWRNNIKKIVDFGCAELNLFKYLKHIHTVEEILEVDVNRTVLCYNQEKILALIVDHLNRRTTPLNVRVLCGSIADPDSRLIGCDMVLAVEIIEHLYPDTLEAVPYNIFHFIQPLVALFTTPNAEFNVLFSDFKSFRHADHKFEWSRSQFEEWALNITTRFPNYEVTFGGIGAPPDEKGDIGCCTQIAIFTRRYKILPFQKNDIDRVEHSSYGICTYFSHNLKRENGEKCEIEDETETLNKSEENYFYEIIAEESYPYEIDNKTIDEKILLEIKYVLGNGNIYNEHYVSNTNRLEYPISKLYKSVENLCSLEDLKILLGKHYQVEVRQFENNSELCVLFDLPTNEDYDSEECNDSWSFKENEKLELDWSSTAYSSDQWSNHSIAGDNTNSFDDFSMSGYEATDLMTSEKDISKFAIKCEDSLEKSDQNACDETENSSHNLVKILSNNENIQNEIESNTKQNRLICSDQNNDQIKMTSKPSSIDSTKNSPIHSSQKSATINSIKISPLKSNINKESPNKTISTTSSASSLQTNPLVNSSATDGNHITQGQSDSLVDSGYQKSPQSPIAENFTSDDSDSEMTKFTESKEVKSDLNITENSKKNSKSKFKFTENKIVGRKKDLEKNEEGISVKSPEVEVIQLDILQNAEPLVNQEPLPLEAENIAENQNQPRLQVVENGDLINNNRDGEGNNYEEQNLAFEAPDVAEVQNNDNVPQENLDFHNENHIVLEENQENVLVIQQNPEVDDDQPNVPICENDEKHSLNDGNEFDLESPPPSSLDVNFSNNDIQINNDSIAIHPIHVVNIGGSFENQEANGLAVNDNENGLNILAEPFPDWLIRLLRGNVEASEDLDFMSQGDNLTVNPNDDEYDDSSSSQETNDNEAEDDDDIPGLIDIESDEGFVIDASNIFPVSSSQGTINNLSNIDNEDEFFDTIDSHSGAEIAALRTPDTAQQAIRINNFSSTPTLELNTPTETTQR